jgi:hypothetical protein
MQIELPRREKEQYDTVQCMRCQQYGHTKYYCNKPFICVKCCGSVIVKNARKFVEIKCQLDATDDFYCGSFACSTCFGHHYAHHQELESIIQLVAACGLWCGLLQQPANRTHNPHLHTIPT